MNVGLHRVTLPAWDVPLERPLIPAEEYMARTRELYASAGVDWVAVYGDREHNANLLYFSNFDPRFEEALLLLGPQERRVLIVGNEGLTHVRESRLPAEVVLYQPFSLMGQPRGTSPALGEVLEQSGIQEGDSVGVVGWKYLAPGEATATDAPAFVPAFLVRSFDQVTGVPSHDVTPKVMDVVEGVRSHNSASQIAQFEWGAARASAAVMRVVNAVRPGMSELEAAQAMGYAGEPLSCHVMLASSDQQLNGLRSPSPRQISQGDGATVGIGYWGGLCCRAGVVDEEVDEEFLENFVKPYYAAIASWWTTIGIGVSGGEVHSRVMDALLHAPFTPALNPGHLGSYDEWLHSPIQPRGEQRLFSGMVLQCDIIPVPLPDGRALNCEDTVAIADAALRDQLAADYPEVWGRVNARKQFMQNELHIELKPEVLPLSSAPAYLAPFWLSPDLVCTLEG